MSSHWKADYIATTWPLSLNAEPARVGALATCEREREQILAVAAAVALTTTAGICNSCSISHGLKLRVSVDVIRVGFCSYYRIGIAVISLVDHHLLLGY